MVYTCVVLCITGEGDVSPLPRCVCHFMLPQTCLQGRVIFLYIHNVFALCTKILCEHAADIFLLLSMESGM